MPDTISLPLLASVQIASPCSAGWENMKGDNVTRFCADCKLHVHNISEMTSDQAEAFLQESVGADRVCIRMFRRADGTILTQDCPVGIALWRRRARYAVGRAAAALLFLASGGLIATAQQREGLSQRLRAAQPFRSVCEWLNPTVAPVLPAMPFPGLWADGRVILGGGVTRMPANPPVATAPLATTPRGQGPIPIDLPELPR